VDRERAKTTVLVFYPVEAGDIDVDVTAWNGTAVSSPATAGIPEVNVKNINNVFINLPTRISKSGIVPKIAPYKKVLFFNSLPAITSAVAIPNVI